jgi:hypothetical protein
MNWNDVLDRLSDASLKPSEEIYLENYGKYLAVQRPEFDGRYFRCTYGIVHCEGLKIEVFMFPSQVHLEEFLEVIGGDPWWIARHNLALHFPECDPALVDNILHALDGAPR